MPAWLASALALIAAVGLVLTFPARDLQRSLEAGLRGEDPLEIAYMQAWLTAHPDAPGLRRRLTNTLIELGAFDAAREQLRRLARDVDRVAAERIAVLELDLDAREAFSLRIDDPRRAALLARVFATLESLSARPLAADIELELAQRALDYGARRAAVLWLERLIERDDLRPGLAWWEARAASMLALGESDLAARLLMRALAEAQPYADKRRLFLQALRTLAAAGRYDEALAAAETHLGELAGDIATLEFLTRFALAAGRPDVAQRYARMLLRLSLRHWQRSYALASVMEPCRLRESGEPVPCDRTTLDSRLRGNDEVACRPRAGAHLRIAPVSCVRTTLDSRPRLRWGQALRGNDSGFIRVQLEDRAPQLPFDDRLYQLSYDVFVANGNLKDALAVARAAVRQAPRSTPWRLRLAQVADWSGLPELALENWHAVARATGDDKAWAEVLRRAPQVSDNERWLEALQRELRRRPQAIELVQTMVGIYERRGEPQQALALLQARRDGPHRRIVLENIARLAQAVGDEPLRRATWRALNREFGPNAAYARGLAEVEAVRGDAAAAFAAIASAVSLAKPDDRDFWSAYAELARAAGNNAAAIRGYRQLLAAGRTDVGVYNDLAAILETDAPHEAALVMAQAFDRFGEPYLALRVIYLLQSAGNTAGVRAFFNRLTQAQLARLTKDADFLSIRAQFLLAEGKPREALRDAEAALAIAPDNLSVRALVVWALITVRDAPALRDRLARWSALAVGASELWAPFAAGWLALQEPVRALRFIRLRLQAGGDPAWWLDYADAHERIGHVEHAWQARAHAWPLLRDSERTTPRSTERRALAARLVPLALSFEAPDRARARLYAFLRERPGTETANEKIDDVTRDAALAYWIGREHSELAQAWLLRTRAHIEMRPEWAALSVALATGDRPQVRALLDGAADWLPIFDRIEAAQRVADSSLAQSLAFEPFERLPHNEELHARLLNLTTRTPDFAGGGGAFFRQRPLREHTWTLDGALGLSSGTQVAAQSVFIDRVSTDEAQLVGLANERLLAIALLRRFDGDGGGRLQLHARDGVGSSAGLLVQGERDVTPRLRLGARIGIDDLATDSVFLRAGGERDTLAFNAFVRLSQREFASLSVEANRYSALDGGTLGRGSIVRAEFGHTLRLDYPDLSLRASLSDLHYRPYAGLDAWLAQLLPGSARAGASNASFLPRSTSQIGVALVCGESARERYTRAWRPWCAFGLNHDRQSGGNYDWRVGAGGAVVGTDHLELSIGGGSSRGADATPFFQITGRYRWLF